jgi:hypothetical protein
VVTPTMASRRVEIQGSPASRSSARVRF